MRGPSAPWLDRAGKSSRCRLDATPASTFHSGTCMRENASEQHRADLGPCPGPNTRETEAQARTTRPEGTPVGHTEQSISLHHLGLRGGASIAKDVIHDEGMKRRHERLP